MIPDYLALAWVLLGCGGFALLGHAAGYAKGKHVGRVQALKERKTDDS